MDENRFWKIFVHVRYLFGFFLFRFEDGTIPFLDIIAVRHGLDALKKIGGSNQNSSFHDSIMIKQRLIAIDLNAWISVPLILTISNGQF